MDLYALLGQFKDGEIDKQKVIDAIDESKSGMVPRSRLNDKNAEIDELKAEITNRDEQIAKLQDSVKDDSELQKELDEVKNQNAEWQTKYQESQLNNAVKLAVAKDANNADDILAFINKDELELQDDGNVKGLDKAIESLKESKPYLFVENKPSGRTPDDGKNVNGGLTQEEFNNMSVAERTNLFVNDRKTYDALINN
ncbi:phage scaffolding protein [Staphylococcus epidermidis]|uniref:phage scaffolding protein n=1 Tax=Staphylococcus epidermidis TaxID=1282 RepID=UPI002555C0B7|nr:phage scaffolding protein [Staphylococcus epidermidis]MDU3977880.1 phage scaffolding protein [Staphylococcus sp.]MDK7864040.1 phage scaffolding protein [Staphylococcus epidermidis]MDK8303172.1 phage scaffolding protein [Staphylococcus epidermidis]MDK8327126.1 phage scaffolding protein [Staphylococcus epidermidis]MDU3950401.1 phage scaffolding protein [Staphylococcus epidermidis]